MRRLSRRASTLLVLVGVGLVLAFAARAVLQVRPAPMSVCLGSPIPLGHSSTGRLDRRKSFLVRVFGPPGGKVWQRRGKIAKRQSWRFKPRRPGLYRTIYTGAGARVEFDTLVVTCRRGVSVRHNGRRKALFTLANAKPGDIRASCVLVTYTGKLPALLRLYGTTRGTGLGRHLHLTVIRGRSTTGVFPSCRGFMPDRKNYLGAGRGVVFDGSLAGFADSYRAAGADPTPRFRRAWKPGESHVYKLIVSLGHDNAAQGLTARQSFTWEARSMTRGRSPRPRPLH